MADGEAGEATTADPRLTTASRSRSRTTLTSITKQKPRLTPETTMPEEAWAETEAAIAVVKVAATAEQPRRRYLVGKDAELIGGFHKQMSDEDFERAMRTALDFWE